MNGASVATASAISSTVTVALACPAPDMRASVPAT